LGPIISNEVLGVNVISDSIASFSDFFGGSSGTYRSKLENLKKTVLNDLKKAMNCNLWWKHPTPCNKKNLAAEENV
jgi:uncharacterized protein YbjQ (UPF0145 family)